MAFYIAKDHYRLTEGVDSDESDINGYFSTSIAATLETKDACGLSTKAYMCVTRSRTISFLTSGFSLLLDIAVIMLGFHFCGTVKSFFFESAAADDGTDDPDTDSETSDVLL